MSNLAVTAEPQAATSGFFKLSGSLSRRRLFLIVMLGAAVVYGQFQFWKLPSRGDRANWEYFAQVIARGGIPYRDVVNIKSPLSAYIGAAAIVAGRPFGLRDILAIRIAYILLGVLSVGLVFLIASDYFNSRRIGVLAAMVMLSFNTYASSNSGGIQPKTPMVIFGLLALWAVYKDRPFVAGVFGMLSTLSWQPGFLFVGVAGLAFSRHLTRWRDPAVLRLIAGTALPLVLLIAYFWIAGGLKDFYLWNFHYNYTVYGPREIRPVSQFFKRFGDLLHRPYRDEAVYFYLAAIALITVLVREVLVAKAAGPRRLAQNAPRHAVIIAPLVYFAFCMVNIQGGADFIPLLPFVSIYSAVAVVLGLDALDAYVRRKRPASRANVIRFGGYGLALTLVFALNVADAFRFERGFPTLQDQDREVAEMMAHMEPGDKIFVHGQTELLVLSGRMNASKYFFLDRGKDTYLDKVEPGGFEGWLNRLKADRPKIVALTRMRSVDHAKDFRQWVNEDYERVEGRVFPYYLRRD